MFCEKCGNRLAEKQNFCPYCGSYINGNVNQNYGAPAVEYNLISAFVEMFRNYVDFYGRSRRQEYWYVVLMNCIIQFAVQLVSTPVILSGGTPIVFYVLLTIYGLATLVPSLALTVRRLHDIGKSGWYVLLSLIPIVGSIILIVYTAMDSQPGPNQYGPNPKNQ